MATRAELQQILTPEFLRKEYVDNDRFAASIATEVGCSTATVTYYLRMHGIEVTKKYRNRENLGANPNELLITEDLLREEYQVQRRTIQDIARSLGVSCLSVRKRLVQYGMEIENHRANAPTTRLSGVTRIGQDPFRYLAVYYPQHARADTRGYTKLHILLAEYFLDRSLLPGEVVHHKNGDILDNRPENLEVMTNGAHTAHHNTGKSRKGQRHRKDMLTLQEKEELQEPLDKKPGG